LIIIFTEEEWAKVEVELELLKALQIFHRISINQDQNLTLVVGVEKGVLKKRWLVQMFHRVAKDRKIS
jgi:hypothetical protein